jgi:hypothetical protein
MTTTTIDFATLPVSALAALAAPLLHADTLTLMEWRNVFGKAEVEAAHKEEVFLPSLDITLISDEKLQMLVELERECRRPISFQIATGLLPCIPEGAVLSGGWIARQLLEKPTEGESVVKQPEYSDVDVFVSPDTDVSLLYDVLKSESVGLVYRHGVCVTVIDKDATRLPVQFIVHEQAATPRLLAGSFDFVHLQVWQSGGTGYASAEAVLAWRTKQTFATHSLRQTWRNAKAEEEGFTVIDSPVPIVRAEGDDWAHATTPGQRVKKWQSVKAATLTRMTFLRQLEKMVSVARRGLALPSSASVSGVRPLTASLSGARPSKRLRSGATTTVDCQKFTLDIDGVIPGELEFLASVVRGLLKLDHMTYQAYVSVGEAVTDAADVFKAHGGKFIYGNHYYGGGASGECV